MVTRDTRDVSSLYRSVLDTKAQQSLNIPYVIPWENGERKVGKIFVEILWFEYKITKGP